MASDPGSVDTLAQDSVSQQLSPTIVAEVVFKICTGLRLSKINDLVDLVKEKLPNSSLPAVVHQFKSASFQQQFLTVEHFNFNSFYNFCFLLSEQADFTIGELFFHQAWESNQRFQLEFIKYCLESSYIVCNLSNNVQLASQVPYLDVLKYSPDLLADERIEPWKYQCLYNLLIDLSKTPQLTSSIEETFNVPMLKCPELIVLGFLDDTYTPTLKEYLMIRAFTKLIYLPANPHNAMQILLKIWPTELEPEDKLNWPQRTLLKSLSELYDNASPEDQLPKLSRILDLAKELKALNYLLTVSGHWFALDLACLASQRDYLKLEKWLADKLVSLGDPFVEVVIQFIKKKCVAFTGPGIKLPHPLPLETLNIIFSCFQQYLKRKQSLITSVPDKELFSMTSDYTQYVLFPATTLPYPPLSTSLETCLTGNVIFNPENPEEFFYNVTETFEPDIEEQVDVYFRDIYNTPDPTDSKCVDDFCHMLRKLQESSLKRDHNLYLCALRNLLKEYIYLDQYPEKELILTGELYGALIQYGIINSFILIIVFKYLIDSLEKPPDTRKFRFGIAALERFKFRLRDFPALCSHLFNLSHFSDFPSSLKPYIQFCRTCLKTQHLEFQAAIDRSRKKEKEAALLKASKKRSNLTGQKEFIVIRDKLQFMFNNLDFYKMDRFAKIVKDLLENSQNLSPVALYFTKRAIAEMNHHKLFLKFLHVINLNDLYKVIITKTYTEINTYLQTESEKNSLKSAGHWLGSLTLARNKPVLSVYLDLHQLLIDAYHEGLQKILFVLPFVAKVLITCNDSIVFKPPNPWTVSLLSLLAEIYEDEMATLNIKLEIELLCKSFDISINDYIGHSNKLRLKPDTVQKEKSPSPSVDDDAIDVDADTDVATNSATIQPPTSSSSFTASAFSATLAPAIQTAAFSLSTLPTHTQALTTTSSINTLVSAATPIRIGATIDLTNLRQNLMIKSNLDSFLGNIGVRSACFTCIEATIKQWTDQLLERVVNVSVNTVEHIICKDFALNPSADLMRNYANNFLRFLMSGLQMIYFKEQLPTHLRDNLKATLQNKCPETSENLIELTCNAILNENLVICINYLQTVLIERAQEELDYRLKSQYDLRRNRSTEQPYFSPFVLNYQNEKMPKAIRLKIGPIQMEKLQIYEEISRAVPVMLSLATMSQSNAMQLLTSGAIESSIVGNGNEHAEDMLIHLYDQFIKKSVELMRELESVCCRSDMMHKVVENLRKTKQHPREASTALVLINTTVNGLRELLINKDAIVDMQVLTQARDFYLLILKAMADQRAFNVRYIADNITRFVMEHWFTLEPSFPDDLFDILSKASLINLAALDGELCHYMAKSNANIYITLSFLSCYLRNGLSPTIFPNTIECFRKLAHKVKPAHPFFPELKNLFEICQQSVAQPISMIMENVESLFVEWLNTQSTSGYQAFFHSLLRQGVFKSEETLMQYLRFTFEMCLDLSYHTLNLPNMSNSLPSMYKVHSKCFAYLDAFAHLVIFFIRLKDNIEYKMQILGKALTVVSHLAARDQDLRKQKFHYLPYYRVLVCIFLELCNNHTLFGVDKYGSPKYFLEQINHSMMFRFCATLQLMAPTKMPSFIFAWLEFVSHRCFIGACLNDVNQQSKLWGYYFTLLSDLLIFLRPLIQNMGMSCTFKFLYKGTLKLFLLLLHDFPDFLCEYCYMICDQVPSTAFQIHNLVLSAFPATMRLPDPFSPLLKVESINEILHPYKGLVESSIFDDLPFRLQLENYLKSRSVHYLAEIKQYFSPTLTTSENLNQQLRYLKTIVFYFGQNATKGHNFITIATISNCATMDVIQYLLLNLDSERRYYLLSAMVNHLRYPNLETQYFICVFLYLFQNSQDSLKEQIVRSLLERLFVFRPHPWGLLFIVHELSKNPSYNFWNYDFIKFTPKIKKILANIGVYNGTLEP